MLISKPIRTESGAARSGKGSEVHLEFAKHPNPRSARLSPAEYFLLQLYRRRMTVKKRLCRRICLTARQRCFGLLVSFLKPPDLPCG